VAEAKDDAQEIALRLASDPSILTTQALHREIAVLKEQFNTQISGMTRAFEERLDAIDKATGVFSENLTRVPTETDRAVARLKELHDTRFDAADQKICLTDRIIETRIDGIDKADSQLLTWMAEKINSLRELHEGKFAAIQEQFKERDERIKLTTQNSKEALEAALQAAKEAAKEQSSATTLAIQKLDTATDKRLDAITGLMTTYNSATDEKVSDIKDRVVRIEGLSQGETSAKTEQHTSSSFIVGVIGVGLAVVSAVIAALALMR
jgi:hypothetical protein